ncbi:MAG: transglycosylase SLT domain-containing protein [Anderseniella sp.]
MNKTETGFSTLRRAALAGVLGLAITGSVAVDAQARSSGVSDASGIQELLAASNTRSPARNDAISVKALKAAVKKDWRRAFDLASKSQDQATLKAVEWLYIRKNPTDAGADRIMNFVIANPDWPATKPLTRMAQAILARKTTPVDAVARHYNRFSPISPQGHVAYARLALARGDKATATKSIRKAWANPKLAAHLEKQIASDFKYLLTTSDHKARMWALVMAQETNAAIRAARFVSKAHASAARTAQALIRRKKTGPAHYKKLPAKFRNHPPMIYAYARWMRRKGKYTAAYNILKRAPASHKAQVNPAQWFVEKRLAARHLAGPKYKKYWPGIYKMMAAHGYSSGKQFIEGEFLAGWYALRKLSNPGKAAVHFKRITEAATTRTDGSRGWYWLGRARAAKGENGRAEEAYRMAAASPTLFYSQLALGKLGHGKKPLNIVTGKATAGASKSVRSVEIFRAAHLLARAGGKNQILPFLFPIARAIKSRDEAAAAIDHIHSHAGHFWALRLAKAFGSLGLDVDNWAYPVNAMPGWKTLNSKVERSVILGLSRQESEFNAVAGSHAGARGLMQIMPGTGRLIAKQYKLRGYKTDHLTSKPALNVAMGEAYLGDLIREFKGSYIMGFASYNAGPGNTIKWLKAYGDPRKGQIDAIDWIESIPITETRKYVQKVMQNVHVYRTRLGHRKHTMLRDINRGGRGGRASANTSSASGCGEAKKTIASLISGC